MKLFIATPVYGGITYAKYTLSLVDLVKLLDKAGHQTRVFMVINQSEITAARNACVQHFLKTDFDAMLFVDADHGFGAMDVKMMIESGKSFIGALYPKKSINWDSVRKAAISGVPSEKLPMASMHYVGNLFSGKVTVEPGKPIPVAHVGTGLLFLERSVFETLAPHCDSPLMNLDSDERQTQYFTNIIMPSGVRLSEDYSFCQKWRDLGNDVWAAPWVGVTHIGPYEFDGRLRESFGE